MEPGPRFSPDNSDEARARRMAAHRLLRIVEIGEHRYILGALGNVIQVEFNPEPPEDIIA